MTSLHGKLMGSGAEGPLQVLQVLVERQMAKEKLRATEEPLLPPLPADLLEWMRKARRMVEGVDRHIDWWPYWVQILEDRAAEIMVMAARQTFKTSTVADLLLWPATTRRGVQTLAVFDNPIRLTAFRQKMRVGAFEANPETLLPYVRHGIGNEGEVSLKNRSTVYTGAATEQGKYKNIEGKSPVMLLVDEAQYHPLEDLSRLQETRTQTKAPLWMTGIGGEAGSPYEKLWLESDQREWEFDDDNWRDRLEFDGDGLVMGDYLTDVLAGHWRATYPDGEPERHGYHLTQKMMPTIALTMKDAREKYKIDPKFSLEYKRLTWLPETFATHVMAECYRSARRPITYDMIKACMAPYSLLDMLEPQAIADIKTRWKDAVTVSFGADWGSGGGSSDTVFAALIHWRRYDIFQIIGLEKRPRENLFGQARAAVEFFLRHQCDFGLADLGYGAHQVKAMQDGGWDPKDDTRFDGLTAEHLLGTRSWLQPEKPFQIFLDAVDEHGDKVPMAKIDKASAIDTYISAVEMVREHPRTWYAARGKRPRLIIPYKDPLAVDYLRDDSTDITRKDIPQDVSDVNVVVDPRRWATKEYNHPPDAVMALTYAMLGAYKVSGTQWVWVSAA